MSASLGARMRQIRDDRSLSLDQLGAELGVSGVCVLKWEQDQNSPSLALFVKWCRVLRVGRRDRHELIRLASTGRSREPTVAQLAHLLDVEGAATRLDDLLAAAA